MTNLKITTSSGTFEIPDSGYLNGPGTVCPKTPLHIREMTSKETIQQTKEDIALLQEKLKKLEELDRVKTPVEEAYKRVYGNYPDTGICNGMSYVWWDVFCKGYNASKEECKVEEEPKPKPKPETLYEALDEVYYGTTYVRKEEICDVVERWLPDEFDPNDSVYEYEIGWNEAIQAIKEKLR
jgi:hypothetical protein